MTNRYPGNCRKCGTNVPSGRGTAQKMGGVWGVLCATCNPVAPVEKAPEGPVRIVVTRHPSGEIRFAPSGYLGPDLFARYREAVSGLRYDSSDRSQRSSDLALVGRALARLQAADLLLDVAQDVSASVQAQAAQGAQEVASADERAEAVDAVLKARGLALFPFQRIGVSWLAPLTGALLGDDMGLGKGHPHGTKLLTPDGWRTIERLRVGDRVIGSDGRPTAITGMFPRGRLPVFSVNFSDGVGVLVDGDHLWNVWEHNDWHRGKQARTVATRDLRGQLRDGAGNCRWRIPMVAPVMFEERALPLDPYLLGVLLGDGALTQNTPSFTPGDEEVPREVEKVLPPGAVLSRHDQPERATSWSIVSAEGGYNQVMISLRALGLAGTHSHERFVPASYLFADVVSRLALLQGLMDTDGELRREDGHVSFCSTSLALAEAVQFLVQSLGGTASNRTKERPQYMHNGERRTGRRAFILSIALPEGVSPFRARQGYTGRTKYPPARLIRSIEPHGEAEVICISVAAKDQLYVTEHCIVTHNTIQALTALPEGAPVLVVGPAIAKGVWHRECRKWRPDLTPIILSGRGSFRWPQKGELLVVNYDVLPAVVDTKGKKSTDRPKDAAAWWKAWSKVWGAIGEAAAAAHILGSCPAGVVLISDEAHALKGGNKTQRGARFKALAARVREMGGRTWGLTATPLLNRPAELWQVCSVFGVEKEAFGSWRSFMRVAGGSEGRFGIEWEPERMDRATLQRMLQRVMLRRLKVEVLKDLPPKTYSEVTVELPSKVAKLCDAALAIIEKRGMTAEAMLKLANEKGSPSFETMSKARAALAMAKLEAAIELIEAFEDADEPLVVFSAHRAPIDVLATRSGWASITGETPPAERTRIEEAFQAGHLRGVACTIKAAGVAITLTRASNAIRLDKEWNPALNIQAEDRIYRIGTSKPVVITDLVSDHPIEERVNELLAKKGEFIANSVDAAKRGAEEAPVQEAADLDAAAARLAGEQAKLEIELAAYREREAKRQAAQAARDAEEAASRAVREATEKEGKARSKARAALARRGHAAEAAELSLDEVRRPPQGEREEWAMRALVQLAGDDPDHARDENGAGFSKSDVYIGHDMAARVHEGLVDVEWKLAVIVCSRYWRQVGPMPGGPIDRSEHGVQWRAERDCVAEEAS